MCVESLRKISKIYNNENAKCQMIAIANKTLSINGAIGMADFSHK
jgi:hypothetical protein